MLRLQLGQGLLSIFEPKQIIDVWYDDTVCPMGSRQYNSRVVKEYPPIDVMYNIMKKLGYSGEEIIDELLKIYHRFRNFKLDYLAESEVTIGFIGYRGTGKSASIVKVAIEDFLLVGKNVWSNMPICVEVFYKDAKKIFSSQPVPKLKLLEGDTTFQNGLVIEDEVNMEVADSSRYMATTNLEFTNQIQMIRKKGLDVIWSAQNWNTVDARLRWQSDYIVLCSLQKPEDKGLFSYWRVMDSTGLSGKLDFDIEMRSHYLLDKIVQEGMTFIRPWWRAYDTKRLQGQQAYNKKELLKEGRIEPELDGDTVQESLNPAYVVAKEFRDKYNTEKIYCKVVYERTKVGNNRAAQIRLGRAFHSLGYIKKTDNYGPFWTLEKDVDIEVPA